MLIAGPVMLIGDDISTDLIYPGRYLTVADRSQQALHALEGMGAGWPERLRGVTILAAGWNVGCGSSREQAATALLGAGVKLVVARSFSRLFLRNCINNGLPIIECPALVDCIECPALIDRVGTGVTMTADLAVGEAVVGGQTVRFSPLPAALLAIVGAGGLLAQLRGRGAPT
jgi:3-isopropylmalate/(R)-2-methylmalate dehydratase small subunit